MKQPLSRRYGKSDTPRMESDFYETPREATLALIDNIYFSPPVLEPACGRGAIVRVLEEKGYGVMGYDIRDYGKGFFIYNFMDLESFNGGTIITNPPYERALEFVEKAVGLLHREHQRVIMLLRLDFLASQGRKDFLQSSPLKEVWVFSKRIGFKTPNSEKPRKGINYAWFVWEYGYSRSPIIEWL